MKDWNGIEQKCLLAELDERGEVRRLIRLALDEDLGAAGDITTKSLREADRKARVRGAVCAREGGVVSGTAAVQIILEEAGCKEARWQGLVMDGSRCEAGEVIGELRGTKEELLGIERTVLNVMGRLSGIATATARFVEAVKGTGAKICDTRKTTPGMRVLEKYAVRCGGGWMHRMGLFDALLYKDNHLAGVRDEELGEFLGEAIRRAREQGEVRFVEVEVDRLAQLEVVLGMRSGLVDVVLLDNMSVSELGEAAAMRDARAKGVLLEASGGVKLERVRVIAETGVDRISVGALTHSVKCMDVGLDLE